MTAIPTVDMVASTVLNTALTEVVLTGGGTDTFTFYDLSRVQIMVLRNTTGATITPRLIGTLAPATDIVEGIGLFNASNGALPVAAGVAAGGTVAVLLNRYWRFLRGDCSISASTGTGLTASIFMY